MAAKRFRCMKCNAPNGFEFEADGPKCPSCGLGGMAVLPLVDVHFHETMSVEDAAGIDPSKPLPPGLSFSMADGRIRRVACRPNKAWPSMRPDWSVTGVPSVVTCPACKATPAYERALAEQREMMED